MYRNVDLARCGKAENRRYQNVVLEKNTWVSWTEFRTNVSILQELGIKQRLFSTVQSRILTFFGHVSRRGDQSIERLVVQGKVEGTRPRGKSPTHWADQIKSAVGESLNQCSRMTSNWQRWRSVVKRITSAPSTTYRSRPLWQERTE
ncbi:uncharacterized protein LOC123690047 [Pieris rapae]|uniref:uncharacterized protein LOC123690047 n=1 Tax=Pieris rapae TaxID=64459 RepID=UPI001E27D2BC|nr:uncharacterized protein LOC123690047 [Pieris rapae]